MKSVLLLITVALTATVSLCDDAAIAGQKARVADLQEKLAGFRANINTRAAAADELEAEIGDVKSRLREFEPSNCDDRTELQCGGDRPKCVSRLIVCDFNDDCPNGYDESECETLTPSGSIWRGTMVYDHCTKRKPKTLNIYIENYRIFDYFRPFPEITARLSTDEQNIDYSHENDLELHGWMDLNPGNHILYLEPPENDGLALACIFDSKDKDRCHGEIIRQSTQEICAEFYAVRSDKH